MKSLFLSLLILAGCASQAPAVKKQPQIFIYESDGNGFNTKTFFYDNGEEVVAIDSQFTGGLATEALKFIKSRTKSPVSYLIVTHPNPDKFNGMREFQAAGAKVVTSNLTMKAIPDVHAYKKYFFVNMAKMFTEETYPKTSSPDITFDDHLALKLKNGEEIQLQELGKPGVSSNQTVVYVAGQKALFVGDLVHHQAHAWLEGGIVNAKPVPTIKSWIGVLEELNKTYADAHVYGGRGVAAPANEAIPAQIKYLKTMDQIVNSHLKSLGRKRKLELSKNAAKVHQDIQKKAEAAFPDYQLGYMIQYGVYGLVNSKK